MSRRLRFWLVAVLAAAGLLAGGLYLLLRDEPPPADGDLLAYRRNVPDEANGFWLLDLGREDIYWPEDDLEEADPETAEGEAVEEAEEEEAEAAEEQPSVDERLIGSSDKFDRGLAAEVIARNEGVLHRLEEALARRDFQVPESLIESIDLCIAWRRLATVLLCRSRLRLEQGHEAQALQDAVRCIRFGQRVQGSQGPLLQYIVGSTFHAMGSHQLLYLARRVRLRPEDLKPLIRSSAALYPELTALQDSFRAEYAYFVRRTAESPGDAAYDLPQKGWTYRLWWTVYKPNQTRRLMAEEVRLLIREASRPAAARVIEDARTKYAAWVGDLGTVLSGGKSLLSGAIPDYASTLGTHDDAALHLSAARLMLALKCHETVQGKLPGSLADLVPAYLDRSPVDPGDEKTFRYSPEERTLEWQGAGHVDSARIEFSPGTLEERGPSGGAR